MDQRKSKNKRGNKQVEGYNPESRLDQLKIAGKKVDEKADSAKSE